MLTLHDRSCGNKKQKGKNKENMKKISAIFKISCVKVIKTNLHTIILYRRKNTIEVAEQTKAYPLGAKGTKRNT